MEIAFEEVLNLTRSLRNNRLCYRGLVVRVRRELRRFTTKRKMNRVVLNKADTRYFDIKIRHLNGFVKFRISLVDLYLVAFEVGGIWYYFNMDIHADIFENEEDLVAVPLNHDGNYNHLPDIERMNFSSGTFTNEVEILMNFQGQFDANCRRAACFFIVALCEGVRFPSVENTVENSLVEIPYHHGNNRLSKLSLHLIWNWCSLSGYIVMDDPTNRADLLFQDADTQQIIQINESHVLIFKLRAVEYDGYRLEQKQEG